ncbi:hypothetical protein [Gymnodinialimonas ceratoperidinii]|uniref:Uncharacterized protein n=1 Tax=Gymnodinialimonas ceratoperidinii TaxID=2856823 RepID=A0A8F6TTJ3_9RHOB|nr:hypothetical protein [Gymnodinialimonas ceratoperidinii]QXT38415.1 hypothetical protein KYE46_10690 [Gymnodinialimonas ceratoperidinii]
MGLANDLAEKLAIDACETAVALDDESIPEAVAQVVGSSSPTTEELFRTAVRVIQAEARARKFLEDKIRAAEAALPKG